MQKVTQSGSQGCEPKRWLRTNINMVLMCGTMMSLCQLSSPGVLLQGQSRR